MRLVRRLGALRLPRLEVDQSVLLQPARWRCFREVPLPFSECQTDAARHLVWRGAGSAGVAVSSAAPSVRRIASHGLLHARGGLGVVSCGHTLPLMSALSPSSAAPALHHAVRYLSAYPSPLVTSRVKGARKKYNYLTSERLVEKERIKRMDVKLPQRLLKQREDEKKWHEVVAHVAQSSRYLSALEKEFVFYHRTKSGNVTLPSRSRRINTYLRCRLGGRVFAALIAPENRDHLVETLDKVNAQLTDEEWVQSTDPETGEFVINLDFSKPVQTILFRTQVVAPAQPLYCFVVENRNNFAVCPPMYEWAIAQGETTKEDLVEVRNSPLTHRSPHFEETVWNPLQMNKIKAAVMQLSEREGMELVKRVRGSWKHLVEKLRAEEVIRAKITLAFISLYETRAVHCAHILFRRKRQCEQIIETKGDWALSRKARKLRQKEWSQLPDSEKEKLYLFNKRTGTLKSMSPLSLFCVSCMRDYGLPRSEAFARWSRLTHLQRMALQFFFLPRIAKTHEGRLAFQRYYREQLQKYGLEKGGLRTAHMAFQQLHHQRWREMTIEERASWEERDRYELIFPLQQPRTRAQAENASTELGGEAPAQMPLLEQPQNLSEEMPTEGCSPGRTLAIGWAESERNRNGRETSSQPIKASAALREVLEAQRKILGERESHLDMEENEVDASFDGDGDSAADGDGDGDYDGGTHRVPARRAARGRSSLTSATRRGAANSAEAAAPEPLEAPTRRYVRV